MLPKLDETNLSKKSVKSRKENQCFYEKDENCSLNIWQKKQEKMMYVDIIRFYPKDYKQLKTAYNPISNLLSSSRSICEM